MPKLKFNPVIHDHKNSLQKLRLAKVLPQPMTLLSWSINWPAKCCGREHEPVSRKTLLPSAWARQKAQFLGSSLPASTRRRSLR